jgi:hypothetical protein
MPFLIAVRCRDRPAKSRHTTNIINTVSTIFSKTSRGTISKVNVTIDYCHLIPSRPIAKTLYILSIDHALSLVSIHIKLTKQLANVYRRCSLVVFLEINKKIVLPKKVRLNWAVKVRAEQLYLIQLT